MNKQDKDKNTHDRLMNAAIKLFATKGYAATTTREIVKEAGSSLSSLQAHFQSKENIYFVAIDQALNRQHQLLKPIFDEIDFVTRQNILNRATAWNLIVQLINKMADWLFLPEEQQFILLMNQELLNPTGVFDKMPGSALLIHRKFQQLFEAYTGDSDAFWAKLLSFTTVMSLFNFVNYPLKLTEILGCDAAAPENGTQIQMLMKSFTLSTLQHSLDMYVKEPAADAASCKTADANDSSEVR